MVSFARFHDRFRCSPTLRSTISRVNAAAASGSDLADLWIAKVVSIIFFRAPTHAAAAARPSPFRPVLFPSIVFTSLRRLPDSSSALASSTLGRSSNFEIPDLQNTQASGVSSTRPINTRKRSAAVPSFRSYLEFRKMNNADVE